MNLILDLDNNRFAHDTGLCVGLRNISFLEGTTYTGRVDVFKDGEIITPESTALALKNSDSLFFYCGTLATGNAFSLSVDGLALRNDLAPFSSIQAAFGATVVYNSETFILNPMSATITNNPNIQNVPLYGETILVQGNHNTISGDSLTLYGDFNSVQAQTVVVSGEASFTGDATVTATTANFTGGTNTITSDLASFTGGVNSLYGGTVSIDGGRNAISGDGNTINATAPRIYGAGNTISGSEINISGGSNVIENTEAAYILGSNNTFYPNNAYVTGDNNTLGYANNVYGNNNIFNGDGFTSLYGTASITGGQNQIVGTVFAINNSTNILSGSSKFTASFWLDEIYTGNFQQEFFVEDLLNLTGYKLGAISSGTAGSLTGAFYQRSTGNLTGMICPFSFNSGQIFKSQGFASVTVTGGNRIGFNIYSPSSGISGMAGVTLALLGNQSFIN